MNLTEGDARMRERVNERLRMSHYKELSNKILDGLDNLTSKGSAAEVRWIWELIQNAKDASIGQEQVEISIIANDKEVVFSHSGNPFTMDDIFSIINQTSSKNRMDMDGNADDENIPETTGKFGTGFITTHLLSRVIYLQSVFKDFDEEKQQYVYRQFKITLDRSARNLDQFIKEYDRLFKIFDELNNDSKCPRIQYQQGGMYTQFTYPLQDTHNIQTMKQGLVNFRNTAAYVLAFNPRIKSIKVNDEIYTRQSEQIISPDFRQTCIINGNPNEIREIVVLNDKIVHLAFTIKRNNATNEIQQKDPQFPGLFSDFPLIGSQNFIFPCIVNSHVFWPNEERSSIILKQSARSRINQQVLGKAIQLILKFMIFTQTQIEKWNGLEKLCHIKIPDHADFQWYRQNLVTPFINYIVKVKFIRSKQDVMLDLTQVIFPKIDKCMQESQASQLWNLIQPFYGDLIKWDHKIILKWFEIFSQDEYWTQALQLQKNQIDFFAVTKILISLDKISNLRQKYFQNQEEQTFRFLEHCYNYMTQYHKPDDWQKLKLFSNQNSDFREYLSLMKDQDQVDNQYKDILILAGKDIRNELFSQSISLSAFKQVAMKNWTFKDCVALIKTILDPRNTQYDQKVKLSVAQRILLLAKSQQFDEKQNKFLKIVKPFFPDYVISPQRVNHFDQEIYTLAKKQLVQTICGNITIQYSNLHSFKSKLNLQHEQAIELLEGIYEQVKELLMTSEWQFHKIFIDQNCHFKQYDELQKDQSILDEDYKEILKGLGLDIKSQLFALDISLKSFESQKMNIYQFSNCVQYIQDSLNKCESMQTLKPQIKSQYLQEQNELALKIVVLKEINNKRNVNQNAKHIDFINWVQKVKTLGKISQVNNYDWNLIQQAEKIVLTNILKFIDQQFVNFSQLQEHLKIDNNLVSEWLTHLYTYMESYLAHQWQGYKVFINQNGQFQLFKALKVDLDIIDEVYKDILKNDYKIDQRNELFDLTIDLSSIKYQLTNQMTFSHMVVIFQEKIQKNQVSVAKKLIALLSHQIEITTDENKQQKNYDDQNQIISNVEYNNWIDNFYSNKTTLIKVSNYSQSIFDLSLNIIVQEFINQIKQKQSFKEVCSQLPEQERVDWFKQLYSTIARFNTQKTTPILLMSIIPNQRGQFIKEITKARVDQVAKHPDLQSYDWGLKLKELCLPILEQENQILSQNFVDIRFNSYFIKNQYFAVYGLKELSCSLDTIINNKKTNTEFYVEQTGLILKLNDYATTAFQKDKFAKYFPLYDQNREKLIASVHNSNPTIQKNLCNIMTKPNGGEMLETVGSMSDEQMAQVKKIMGNENGIQLLEQVAELVDQDIPLVQKCLQLATNNVLSADDLGGVIQNHEQVKALINLPKEIKQKVMEYIQQQIQPQINDQTPNPVIIKPIVKSEPIQEQKVQYQYNLSFNQVDPDTEKRQKQEARYMQNPKQFFEEHLITTQQNLQEAIKKGKCSDKFTNYLYTHFSQAQPHVLQILERAIKKVKERLSGQQHYNTANWKADQNHSNKNIIYEVKKFNYDIIIVIRPTDGGFVKFHQDIEIQTLMQPQSELWGNNQEGKTQQLTFGKMINWNNINQFKVLND